VDLLLLTMRLLHVVLGAFWAGTLIFNALFLVPAIRDAGPEGAKVAAGLLRRRFLDIMPIAAALTILSGLWLYWRMSGGFQSAYVRSPTGLTLAFGGLAALSAFAIGVGVMRPATLQAASLAQAAAQVPSPEHDARLAAAQRLRLRAASSGRVVALLLALALGAMALARYV
jgi:hypothetical protein